MKKLIRRSVFESNSSSTHSVTIVSRSKLPQEAEKPLVEDGVIYPYRLKQYSTSVGYDGSALSCDTKDKKAAWLIQVLDQLSDDVDSWNNDSPFHLKMLDLIKESCGYSSVDFEQGDSQYRWGRAPNGEYDGDFEFGETEQEVEEEVKRSLEEYVLNNDVIICDDDIPN